MSRGEEPRRYETMVVVRQDLQEAGVKEQIERIRKLLEANGATVDRVHEWGLRELAYDIGKERRGYYVVVEYASPVAARTELERTLKLSDAVLRFVSVRQGKDAPVEAPPQRLESAQRSGDFAADPDERGADVETADGE